MAFLEKNFLFNKEYFAKHNNFENLEDFWLKTKNKLIIELINKSISAMKIEKIVIN